MDRSRRGCGEEQARVVRGGFAVICRLMLTAVAVGFVFAAGCKHKCGHHCNSCRDGRPLSAGPATPGNPFLLPPAGLPTTPGPGSSIPPVGPSDLRNYPPPGQSGPEVLYPDPIPGTGSSRSSNPRVLGEPVKPQATQRGSDSPPTGLSGYVRVKEGLAAGRKPTLDGFDALKQAGFRTVIYLHAAGADWSAAKEVATKRGLAFVAIETTPEKLAAAIDRFNATVADTARHPIYVFDDDGVRAGAIWYVHFRTADSLNDDAARVRARPLGLTEDGDEAKAFAVATQRYLEMR
jgi:protein tyrosine phosphatase (PTP) superfamily phosphohydrolase (DUF442 family)